MRTSRYGIALKRRLPGAGHVMMRRGVDVQPGRARARTAAACLVTVGALAVVLINIRVNALEDQAQRDLTGATHQAGLEHVTDVRFDYPFWTGNLGLASRNDEPFPYCYGSLDVELDGCLLPHWPSWSLSPSWGATKPRPS